MRGATSKTQLIREAVAFGGVGAVGFLIDATVLSVLVLGLAWSSYTARLASFGAAVSVTWLLNRLWTFRHRATSDRKKEYSRYFLVQSGGALLNCGVFAAAIALHPPLAHYPVVPLAFGSAVAMLFNFGLSRALVYSDKGAV